MSQRTLIEINHDYGYEIEKHPEKFMAALLHMIRAGSSPEAIDRLEFFGIRHVGQRHHSDRCAVTYPYHKVEL